MAENPYVNKVQKADGTVIMDVSSDTVTPSDVLNGVTFHDRSGTPQTGSLITHNVYDGLDSSSTSDALSAKQGKKLHDISGYNCHIDLIITGSSNDIATIIKNGWSSIINDLKTRSGLTSGQISFIGKLHLYNGNTAIGTQFVFGCINAESPYAGSIIYTHYSNGNNSKICEIRYDGTSFTDYVLTTDNKISKYGNTPFIRMTITSNTNDVIQCIINNWSNIGNEVVSVSGINDNIIDYHGILNLKNGNEDLGAYYVLGSYNGGNDKGMMYVTQYANHNVRVIRKDSSIEYKTIAMTSDIPSVYDGLDSSSTTSALSAKQGKKLHDISGYNCYINRIILQYNSNDVATVFQNKWSTIKSTISDIIGLTSGIISFNGIADLKNGSGTALGSYYIFGSMNMDSSTNGKGKLFYTAYADAHEDVYELIYSGSTFTNNRFVRANQVPKKILAGTKQANGDITSVTFDSSFASDPIVVVTPINSSTPKNWTRACCITEITTSGFKFVEMVRNADGSSFICGTDNCKWIAMDV